MSCTLLFMNWEVFILSYMEKVGEKIRKLREETGTSQQKIADLLGVTRQSLSLYEKGERTINVESLGKLAEFFGVSADYLLGLSDVRSTEQDMRTACEVTGLAEKTIKSLQALIKVKSNPIVSDFSGEEIIQVLEMCIQDCNFISLLNKMIDLSDREMRKEAFLCAAAKEYIKFFNSPEIADPVEALMEYYMGDHYSIIELDDRSFFHNFDSFVWRIGDSLRAGSVELKREEWDKLDRTSGDLGYARYRFEKELHSVFSDLECEMYYNLEKTDILQKEYSDILQNHYDLLKSISIAITEEANNHAKMEQETAE